MPLFIAGSLDGTFKVSNKHREEVHILPDIGVDVPNNLDSPQVNEREVYTRRTFVIEDQKFTIYAPEELALSTIIRKLIEGYKP
jgi:hypothetical protein